MGKRLKNSIHWFYLYLCLIFTVCSFAEVGSVPVESLAALSDARRLIVHNDCLWIAGGGLIRYRITKNTATQYVTEQGLAANAVFDAAVDAKNRVLWAATSSGLGRLDLETNQWESFGRAEGLLDPFILSLGIYDGPGKNLLFIGTRTEGLYFLQEGGGKITRAVDKKILPDPWVSCIAPDPGRHYLWIGTAAGVVRFRFTGGNRPLEPDPAPTHNDIAAKRLLVNKATGDVFCLNYYNEIFIYRLSSQKWGKIPSPPGKDIQINDIVLDRPEGILWAASGGGIYKYPLKQKRWTPVPGYRGAVYCITLDPRGAVLYYTSRQGLHSLSPKPRRNESCPFLPNSPPFNNTVSAIFVHEKTGTTWVGSDWGIARFENKSGRWTFFPLSSYPEERVITMVVDDKRVWFGTVYHALCKMDRKTGTFTEIKGTPEKSMVTSIVEDEKRKKIWFGVLGSRGGVYEYDMDTGAVRVLPFLDSQSVTYLLEDGDRVWVGTGRGVAVFHKLRGPGADPFDPRLAFGQVLTLALDTERNHLWITTEFKVVVYDRAKKQHKIFKTPDGFPWSPVTSILYDGRRIWLGSEGYGLYVYNPMEGVQHPLTRVEGTADGYIITLTHHKREGVVWVGTVYGGISIVNGYPFLSKQ